LTVDRQDGDLDAKGEEDVPSQDPPSVSEMPSQGFILPELMPTKTLDSEDCFSIVSHHNMATQCALEIFSGFVEAVASQINTIGGVTQNEWDSAEAKEETAQDEDVPLEPVPQASDDASADGIAVTERSPPVAGSLGRSVITTVTERPRAARIVSRNTRYNGTRWRNSVLHSFSQTLIECGIVSNIEEANVVVIPPFARRNLLPQQLGQVRLSAVESESEDLDYLDEERYDRFDWRQDEEPVRLVKRPDISDPRRVDIRRIGLLRSSERLFRK
jgi:hypothetical protein